MPNPSFQRLPPRSTASHMHTYWRWLVVMREAKVIRYFLPCSAAAVPMQNMSAGAQSDSLGMSTLWMPWNTPPGK